MRDPYFGVRVAIARERKVEICLGGEGVCRRFFLGPYRVRSTSSSPPCQSPIGLVGYLGAL